MKKLSKMLALGLAMALTFGMTVSAAASPNPDASQESNAQADKVADVTVSTGTATYTALDAADMADANELVASIDADEEFEYATIVGAVDVTLEGVSDEALAKGVTLTLNIAAVKADKTYIALHYAASGLEVLPVTVNQDGVALVTLNSTSPIVIVECELVKDGEDDDDDDDDEEEAAAEAVSGGAVSPKTGEALPVAGVMAVICLAGVAFCNKKARI
ncbi:MAG: hypothetical protein II994_02590 [Lachnospiraceae bacterium]|nr:hypothetical protein [Lachnospiraceae bacterium]